MEQPREARLSFLEGITGPIELCCLLLIEDSRAPDFDSREGAQALS